MFIGFGIFIGLYKEAVISGALSEALFTPLLSLRA